MATYRRIYDSRHLQADCQEPGSAPEHYTLGNRVSATFTFYFTSVHTYRECRVSYKFVRKFAKNAGNSSLTSRQPGDVNSAEADRRATPVFIVRRVV